MINSMNKFSKNGYALSRQWFDFIKYEKEEVKPIHAALYFWIVEKNNILKWKDVFGLPTLEAMKMIGIKDRRSYRKALEELERWGFIKVVYKSTNQYKASKIKLNYREKRNDSNYDNEGLHGDNIYEYDEPARIREDIRKQTENARKELLNGR